MAETTQIPGKNVLADALVVEQTPVARTEASTALAQAMENTFDTSSKETFRGFLRFLAEEVAVPDLLADENAQVKLGEFLAAGKKLNPYPTEERRRLEGPWSDTRFVSGALLKGDPAHLYYFADEDPSQLELRRAITRGGDTESYDPAGKLWRKIPGVSSSDVITGHVTRTVGAAYSNSARTSRMELAKKIIDRDTTPLETGQRGILARIGFGKGPK